MLALTVDRILEGRLEESRDIVARRFSRVEAEDSGALRPELAARFEIIPGVPISGRDIVRKETMTDLNSKWQNYRDGPREGSPRRWCFGQEVRGSSTSSSSRCPDPGIRTSPSRAHSPVKKSRGLPFLQQVRWRSPSQVREAPLPAPLDKSGVAMPAPERLSAPRSFMKDKRRRQKKKGWPNKPMARGPFHPAPPPLNLGHPTRLGSPRAPGLQPWRGEPFWLRDFEARRHKGKSRPKGPGK